GTSPASNSVRGAVDGPSRCSERSIADSARPSADRESIDSWLTRNASPTRWPLNPCSTLRHHDEQQLGLPARDRRAEREIREPRRVLETRVDQTGDLVGAIAVGVTIEQRALEERPIRRFVGSDDRALSREPSRPER